jgi:hypothetical protein
MDVIELAERDMSAQAICDPTDRRSAAAVVWPPISGGFLLCGATKTVI